LKNKEENISSDELSRKDTLKKSQHESDNYAIKLFKNDKDAEAESEDKELSQGIGNEGWENVFNELDQIEEEYQDSSLNNNNFQADIQ
jgi:hypothetical protein